MDKEYRDWEAVREQVKVQAVARGNNLAVVLELKYLVKAEIFRVITDITKAKAKTAAKTRAKAKARTKAKTQV